MLWVCGLGPDSPKPTSRSARTQWWCKTLTAEHPPVLSPACALLLVLTLLLQDAPLLPGSSAVPSDARAKGLPFQFKLQASAEEPALWLCCHFIRTVLLEKMPAWQLWPTPIPGTHGPRSPRSRQEPGCPRPLVSPGFSHLSSSCYTSVSPAGLGATVLGGSQVEPNWGHWGKVCFKIKN